MLSRQSVLYSGMSWTWVRSVVAVLCVVAFGLSDAHAQKATERFIPIGQSPGLSGQYSVVGTVSAVDLQNRVLSVTGASRSYSVTLTERTLIWLDRSKIRLTNLTGTPEDCREGVRVEIRYENDDPNRPAVWIKVEVAGGTE